MYLRKNSTLSFIWRSEHLLQVDGTSYYTLNLVICHVILLVLQQNSATIPQSHSSGRYPWRTNVDAGLHIIIDGTQYVGGIDVVITDCAALLIIVVLDVAQDNQSERWFVIVNRSKNADTWHPKQKVYIGDPNLELYIDSWIQH